MKQAMTMAAVVLLVAGAAVAGEYTETFDQTYAMDHGGRVALEIEYNKWSFYDQRYS